MTLAAQDVDRALIHSTAAVWKGYLDEQSAALDAAIRPWQLNPAPSRLGDAFRDAAALSIAQLLTDIAAGSFARLYKSSLIEAGSGGENR